MAHPNTKRVSIGGVRSVLSILTSFLFGLALASAFFLWHAIHIIETPAVGASLGVTPLSPALKSVRRVQSDNENSASVRNPPPESKDTISPTLLSGLRILVTVASFDFMQLAHLEEVLDGFQDVCYAGSKVDVVIYTTVVVSSYVWHMNIMLHCASDSLLAMLYISSISTQLHL
jgi:hypothetical protein